MIEVLELLALDDVDACTPDVVGTKAGNLARLRHAGFTVPPGWAISISMGAAWQSGEPAPPALRAAVQEAVHKASGPLAVRSSASWEDGTTSAHAGATTTVLNVEGLEPVLGAVRRCLDESETARTERGVQGGTAILLQRMVQPDFAGVAFTADPLDGSRDVVRIAATAGLGDALVDGTVIGLDFTVRNNEITGDTGNMRTEDALGIAETADRVETFFGSPQDIEWALSDGVLHLLQARPITILPIKPEEPTGGGWQKDAAHYPEPMTPFGWSVLHEAMQAMSPVFAQVGMLIDGLDERMVGGEIYSRPVPAFGPTEPSGPPPPAWLLGIAARVAPPLRRRNATANHIIESGTLQRWVDEWHDSRRDWFRSRASELRAQDLSSLADSALDDHFEQCEAFARHGVEVHFQLFMPYMIAVHGLHRFVQEALGWDDAQIVTMLTGRSPASRLSDDALAPIRMRVLANPTLSSAIRDNPRQPVQALNEAEPGLGDELQIWMDLHGWGCLNFDAGAPVIAERPSMVSKLLLANPVIPDSSIANAAIQRCRDEIPLARHGEFHTFLDEAQRMYPLRDENTLYVADAPMALLRKWMLEATKRLVDRGVLGSADDGLYLTTEELRGALRNGDDHALTEHILRRRGEEAYVRAHPGPAYLGKQSPMPDVSKLPRPLRHMNEPLLWAVSHEYPEQREAPEGSEDSLLVGIPAAPGVVVGPVRIIRSHRDLDRLQDGDVLVCQITTPAWAPLFPIASAVVAEGGGVLSHAAIAAREHGIPAILGTGTATSDLFDGQMIRVDGTTGLVANA